jgi:hypothetical protein
MRIHNLTICLLLLLALGCARSQKTESSGRDFRLSFPDRLSRGEQVVGFELHVSNGRIVALNRVPHDWAIHMLAEAPQSEIRGTPNHGASAFQDMSPLTGFLTINTDGAELDLTGSVIVTRDFTTIRTNLFRKADFVLR